MIELPRRRFITGLASLIAAPAVVRATSIMPVREWKVSDSVPVMLGKAEYWYLDAGPDLDEVMLRSALMQLHSFTETRSMMIKKIPLEKFYVSYG